jgi:hypothetical protein
MDFRGSESGLRTDRSASRSIPTSAGSDPRRSGSSILRHEPRDGED